MKRIILLTLYAIYFICPVNAQSFYQEKYRPQFHFTPPIHWMNDPNGLVYYKGAYHLFYQFNPFGNAWGHMSWGHAVSSDLVHWQHLPLAIPEEKDTMIFSGSCVVDKHNSSGFATQPGQVPMVAIYTGHIEGKTQSQHLAYSLDDGRTWIKYDHNPVLDLGKKDFRDPAVSWYASGEKWVMAVALPQERKIQFYSSKNLKQWEWMSDFGPAGDINGIWECPSLFEVPVQDQPGRHKWVLMLSPAPYMQYFVGEFDGHAFTNENPTEKIHRPDDGLDYYAAIAYNNLPDGYQPISIGWINNWNYANSIPTTPWKSAMSIPRAMQVKKMGSEWILVQRPVEQIKQLRDQTKSSSWSNLVVKDSFQLSPKSQSFELEAMIRPTAKGYSGIRIAEGGEHYLEIGYDATNKKLYADRSRAGDTSFHPAFAQLSRVEIPVELTGGEIYLQLFFDKSIAEIFVNHGERVMTLQLFPAEKDNGIQLFSIGGKAVFDWLFYRPMRSAWR